MRKVLCVSSSGWVGGVPQGTLCLGNSFVVSGRLQSAIHNGLVRSLVSLFLSCLAVHFVVRLRGHVSQVLLPTPSAPPSDTGHHPPVFRLSVPGTPSASSIASPSRIPFRVTPVMRTRGGQRSKDSNCSEFSEYL